MGQALYRTYRSRALSEVVGQEHITDTLARALKAGRISHAYLFTGPRGVGKTSVARILAHEINGLPYSDTPQLDIIEIDAASNRRIDDIRDLREKVHIAPVGAKYKVYIIDEVHMLTGESFNALLKTLEEPPSHVVFILATTEVHKLPATIISRTQRYTFRPGAPDKMVAHLKAVAAKENITIDDAALEIIAEHGEGSFRDSLSLLDQLAHITTGAITDKDVSATLGLAPKEQITALCQAYLGSDVQTIMRTLAALEGQGSNPASVTDQLVKEFLRQSAGHPEVLHVIDALLDVPRAYNPRIKLITVLATPHAGVRIPSPQPKTANAPVSLPAPIVITQAEMPKKSAPKPAETARTAPAVPLTSLEPADWNRILQAVKAKSHPIFTLLKKCQPVVDADKLVLTFTTNLFAKKLDDAKQKAFITQIFQEVLSTTPAIEVAVNKAAVPPVVTDNPHVSSVAAIMGGGEVIDA